MRVHDTPQAARHQVRTVPYFPPISKHAITREHHARRRLLGDARACERRRIGAQARTSTPGERRGRCAAMPGEEHNLVGAQIHMMAKHKTRRRRPHEDVGAVGDTCAAEAPGHARARRGDTASVSATARRTRVGLLTLATLLATLTRATGGDEDIEIWPLAGAAVGSHGVTVVGVSLHDLHTRSSGHNTHANVCKYTHKLNQYHNTTNLIGTL